MSWSPMSYDRSEEEDFPGGSTPVQDYWLNGCMPKCARPNEMAPMTVKLNLCIFLGSEVDFVLDASQSYDPDRVIGETEVFQWECTDSNSNPCNRADSNNPNEPTDLVLPQTSSVTVRSGTLAPNQEYVKAVY